MVMNLKIEYDYNGITIIQIAELVRVFENRLRDLDGGIVCKNFQIG